MQVSSSNQRLEISPAMTSLEYFIITVLLILFNVDNWELTVFKNIIFIDRAENC